MPRIRSSLRSSHRSRSRSRSFRGRKKRSSRHGKPEKKESQNDEMKFKIYQLPENSSDPGSIEVVESSSKWATKYDTEETCSYEDSYGSETSEKEETTKASQLKSTGGCDISELMAAYKTTTDFVHNIDDDDDETADWFLNTLHSSDSFNVSKRSNRKLRMIGGHLNGEDNAMLNDLVPLALELDALSCQEIEEEVVFCEDTSSNDKQLAMATNTEEDENCSITNDAVASLCITPLAQQKLLTKERQKKKDLLGDCITTSSSEEIELEFCDENNSGNVDEVVVVDAVVKALRKSKRKANPDKVSTDVMDVLKSLELMDSDLNKSHLQKNCPKDNNKTEENDDKGTIHSTSNEDDLTLELLGLIGEMDSFSIGDNSDAGEDPKLIETTTKSFEKTACVKIPLKDEKFKNSYTDLSSPSVDVTASITSLSSSDNCPIPTPPQLMKETIRIPPLQKTKKKLMSWKKDISISSFTENEAADSNLFSYLSFNKFIQHGKKKAKNSVPRNEKNLRRSRKLYSSFSFAKQKRTIYEPKEDDYEPRPSEEKSRKVHWDDEQLVDKEEKVLLTSLSSRKCRSIRLLEKNIINIASAQNVERATPNHGYIC